MGEQYISGRQFGILTFVMMLAPLIHAIPIRTAGAGRVSWLLPVLAVLPLGALLWGVLRCLARMPGGSGLGELYLHNLGRRWGLVCCGLSGLWLLTVAVIDLRFCAERYVTAVYPETESGFFSVTVLLLLLWMVRGSLGALARTGKILFWVVLVTLVLVLALSAPRMNIYNVWPITDTSLTGAGLGVLRLSTAAALAVPACFLLGKVRWRTVRGEVFWWMTGLAAAMTVVALVIFGVFGPELAPRLQVPFFALAKEISFRRTIQGMEVIVAATWVMSDTALAGVVLFALGELAALFAPRAQAARVRTGCALLLLPLCLLLPESSFQMEEFYRRYGLPVNLLLGYALPTLALTVGKLRKRW